MSDDLSAALAASRATVAQLSGKGGKKKAAPAPVVPSAPPGDDLSAALSTSRATVAHLSAQPKPSTIHRQANRAAANGDPYGDPADTGEKAANALPPALPPQSAVYGPSNPATAFARGLQGGRNTIQRQADRAAAKAVAAMGPRPAPNTPDGILGNILSPDVAAAMSNAAPKAAPAPSPSFGLNLAHPEGWQGEEIVKPGSMREYVTRARQLPFDLSLLVANVQHGGKNPLPVNKPQSVSPIAGGEETLDARSAMGQAAWHLGLMTSPTPVNGFGASPEHEKWTNPHDAKVLANLLDPKSATFKKLQRIARSGGGAGLPSDPGEAARLSGAGPTLSAIIARDPDIKDATTAGLAGRAFGAAMAPFSTARVLAGDARQDSELSPEEGAMYGAADLAFFGGVGGAAEKMAARLGGVVAEGAAKAGAGSAAKRAASTVAENVLLQAGPVLGRAADLTAKNGKGFAANLVDVGGEATAGLAKMFDPRTPFDPDATPYERTQSALMLGLAALGAGLKGYDVFRKQAEKAGMDRAAIDAAIELGRRSAGRRAANEMDATLRGTDVKGHRTVATDPLKRFAAGGADPAPEAVRGGKPTSPAADSIPAKAPLPSVVDVPRDPIPGYLSRKAGPTAFDVADAERQTAGATRRAQDRGLPDSTQGMGRDEWIAYHAPRIITEDLASMDAAAANPKKAGVTDTQSLKLARFDARQALKKGTVPDGLKAELGAAYDDLAAAERAKAKTAPKPTPEPEPTKPEPASVAASQAVPHMGPEPKTRFELTNVTEGDPTDPVEFARKYADLANHPTKGTGRAKRSGGVGAPVSPAQIELAKRNGIDLAENAGRSIDNFAILHAEARHGAKSGAAKRGEVPVTPEDYAHLHDVLSDPDRVVIFPASNPSAPTKFGLLRRVNGHILYIEETRAGGSLSMTSMRKWPAGSEPPEGFLHDYADSQPRTSPAETTGSITPETLPGSEPDGTAPEAKDATPKPFKGNHAGTAAVREEAGLAPVEKPTHPPRDEAAAAARKAVDGGADHVALAEDVASKRRPHTAEEFHLLEAGGEDLLNGLREAGRRRNAAEKAGDHEAASRHAEEYDRLEALLDRNTEALTVGGSHAGAALAARRSRAKLDLADPEAVVQDLRWKKGGKDAKGRRRAADLTPSEEKTARALSKQAADIDAKLAAAHAEEAVKGAAESARNAPRTREAIRADRADALQSLKKKLDEHRRNVQGRASSLGAVAFEAGSALAHVAPEIGRIARTLVEEGALNLRDVVKGVRAHLAEHDADHFTDREIHDAISGYGIPSEPKLKGEAQARLEEIKRVARATSEVEDARAGHREPLGRQTPVSEEVARLRKMRDELRRQNGITREAQRVRKSVEDTLADLEKRAAQIDALTKEGKTIPHKLREMETEAVQNARRRVEDARTENRLHESIREHEAALKSGDVGAMENALKAKPRRKPSPEIERLTRDRDAVRAKLKSYIESRRPKTVGEKVARYHGASILSGPGILAKLIGASAAHFPAEAFAEIPAAVARRLPAGEGKNLGDFARGEARGSLSAYGKGMVEFFKAETYRDAFDKMRTGVNSLDAAAIERGQGKAEARHPLFDFFGSLHGAIKTPLQRAAYEMGLERRAAAFEREGADLSRTEVQAQIVTGSYVDSLNAILKGDNRLTDVLNGTFKQIETSFGKDAAAMARTVIPITKVPANYVGKALQHTGLGLVEGAFRHIKALRTEGGMTPEAADAIVRAYKRGGVGLGVAALVLGTDIVKGPGYYRPGKKLKKGKALGTSTSPGSTSATNTPTTPCSRR